MKIAVLGHRRFPIKEPFAGGLERFTHNIVKGLQQKGCRVTLFAHPDSDRSLNLSLEPIIDTSFCLNSEEESHEAYLNIMDYLSEADFDLVHDNSLNYFPIILEDRLSIPLVTTLHTPPFSRLLSAVRYRERKQRGYYISISKFNTSLWDLETERLTMIHNGVDVDVFTYSQSVNNYAVWTGRIIPDKGTHLAIEAAQKAKIDLLIAGAIDDYPYFETKIAPYLNKGVEYVGHLAQAELVPLLQSAAVTLCTPTWLEPFGLVVIESLACGTPVVAFDRGAISEILDSQTGILVTPDNTKEMAEAIKKAKHLSRHACRARVLERFSLETMLNKYILAFECIVDKYQREKHASWLLHTPPR
ncbi:glycosyltransferase family 4 protein [Myxosarcina sp. GI1]|uniref:glycosyltransferase family 4 protein n=1 Tax=Myxosarcina sp. GI1 TaxID=1541065 RepID=UPI000689D3CA|nr:glycosyltransferase family 4 protein [Myxosarcina sp. GI1]